MAGMAGMAGLFYQDALGLLHKVVQTFSAGLKKQFSIVIDSGLSLSTGWR